jgi:hypothetical protein
MTSKGRERITYMMNRNRTKRDNGNVAIATVPTAKHFVLVKRTIHLGCYVAVDAPDAHTAAQLVEDRLGQDEGFSQSVRSVLDEARVEAHGAAAANGCCINDTCGGGDLVIGDGYDQDLDLPGVTTPEMRAGEFRNYTPCQVSAIKLD